MKSHAFIALAGVMMLSACAQTPMGSTVPVCRAQTHRSQVSKTIKRHVGSSRSRPWQTKRRGPIFAASARRP